MIFALLALATMGGTAAGLISAGAWGSVESLQSQQALYVADGGLQFILQKEFSNSTDFSTAQTVSNETLGDGQFSVTYPSLAGYAADIQVTGQVGNSVRVIQQTAAMKFPFNFTTYSEEYGQYKGTATMNGDISSGTTIDVLPPFVHNGNPYPDTPLELPTVDMDFFRDLTTSTVSSLTVDASNSPYVGDVYVTGYVFIQDGADVTGLIVSDADIEVRGDNILVNGALVAGGEIEVNMQEGEILGGMTGGGQTLPVLAAKLDIEVKTTSSGTSHIVGLLLAEEKIEVKDVQPNTDLIIDGFLFTHKGMEVKADLGGTVTINESGAVANSFLDENLVLKEWKEV